MSRDPTILQLRAFVAVAQELHFGQAARRLHTSQPPLTRHIQALEEVIGAQLLLRSSRRVELTPAGTAFFDEAQVILGRLDHAKSAALRIAEGHVGALVMGYVEPMGIDIIPRALTGFRMLRADVDLRLFEMHTIDQLSALRAGAIDCGLLRTPANIDPDFSFESVWTDTFVAALPSSHPLADDSAPIDLEVLSDERFLTYESDIGPGMIAATLSGCAAAGFSPNVARQVQSTPMLLAMVASDEGVALVSGETAKVRRPGVRFVALRGAPARSEILLAWRKGEVNVAREDLLRTLQRAAASHELID